MYLFEFCDFWVIILVLSFTLDLPVLLLLSSFYCTKVTSLHASAQLLISINSGGQSIASKS